MIRIRRSEVSFETRTESGVDVVDIIGQLDTFTISDVKAELKKLTDSRHYSLVLNLQEVDYINSTGIGAIVAVAKQVRKRKGNLKIFGMKDDIREVFDIVGASKVLEIFETEEDALSSFS